jgi:hypothetical protein
MAALQRVDALRSEDPTWNLDLPFAPPTAAQEEVGGSPATPPGTTPAGE